MVGTLKTKVALVTGGSSGIGRASAIAFAREGAKVVVAANSNVAGGEETVRMIESAGGEASFLKADVSKVDEVESLINRAVEIYGRLDCAHNNAGIDGAPPLSIVDYQKDTWDKVLSVNLTGVWLCMRAEIHQMLKQGRGAIVNTSSIFGLVGMKGGWGWTAYVATKHGVAGLTKAAGLEYAKLGIRINAVCPGPISTPMLLQAIDHDPVAKAETIARIPMGRLGTPEEVAEAVLWLCSDAASFVTGHMMSVDGGEAAE